MKIGFVGLGLMGTPMATRLLKSGYQLCVHNRTKGKADKLVAQGAMWCDSPAKVAEQTEIILSMLTGPDALREVALGKDGILAGLRPDSVHIDTSTVSPELTIRLANEYGAKGRSFIHSPVLGSLPQAADGSLLLFVGGSESAYRRAESVLKTLGTKIWRFEQVEQATTVKLLCNFFIAGMISTLTQALVFAQKAEINPRTLLEIIGNSALNASMYQTKGASIIERNFAPRFFVEHMLKDIDLLIEAARAFGISIPSGEAAQILFTEAIENGLAKEDYSSVVKVLEKKAGVEVHG